MSVKLLKKKYKFKKNEGLSPRKINEENQNISQQRPISFSESDIDIAALWDDASFVALSPIVNKKNKYKKYLYKRGILFLTHIMFIAVFEIIFFFKIISNYETTSFYSLMNSIIDPLVNDINQLSYEDLTLFKYEFNQMYNLTLINEQLAISNVIKNNYNNKLFINAWIYAICLSVVACIITIIAHFKKEKINILKIITDNVVMILMLSIYEYMFFMTIILNYKFLEPNQLMGYIVSTIDNNLI